FRLVHVRGAASEELAIHDVRDVQRTQSVLERVIGTSSIVVTGPDRSRPPIVLRSIRHGAQLAALIEWLAGDPNARLDADAVAAALAWQPRDISTGYSESMAGAAAVLIAIAAVVIGLHGKSAAVAYGPDDAIYPSGLK